MPGGIRNEIYAWIVDAALAGAESINPEHVAEALSYRSPTQLSRA